LKKDKMKNLKYLLIGLVVFIIIISFYLISFFYHIDKFTKEEQKAMKQLTENTEAERIKNVKFEAERKAEKPWANDILWEMIETNGSHASFSAKINKKVDALTFKLVGHFNKTGEYRDFVPSYIEIRNLSDRKFIQKLIVRDEFGKEALGTWEMELGVMGLNLVELVDLNFDGYLDLRVLLYTGATGVNQYASFLYSPTLKKFIFNKKLTEMSILRINPKSKQLITYDRSGWCYESMRYYEVIDNDFMLTKFEKTEMKLIKNTDRDGSDNRCFKLTIIPREGHAIIDNNLVIYKKGKLSNKLKLIKREELNGSLDGRRRNMMGVPN